jgi:hypothetical protein
LKQGSIALRALRIKPSAEQLDIVTSSAQRICFLKRAWIMAEVIPAQ